MGQRAAYHCGPCERIDAAAATITAMSSARFATQRLRAQAAACYFHGVQALSALRLISNRTHNWDAGVAVILGELTDTMFPSGG